ncbi:MAG: hypothetical protein F6K30_28015 [Cyanothece sp. SIO2G6]|nr:hypothetical protein [Cyanothece sp. SIO2G6]
MLLISALMPAIRNPNARPLTQTNTPSRPLAKVEEAIASGEDGQVYFEGTYWRARFHDPDCQAIAPIGSKVQVVSPSTPRHAPVRRQHLASAST